ncbi:unnamed protein product, partial [Staurois parvus]
GLSPHLYLSLATLLKTLLFSSSINISGSSFFFITFCLVSFVILFLCICSRSNISFNSPVSFSLLSLFFFAPDVINIPLM